MPDNKVVSRNPTELAEFKPTLGMEKWLETQAELMSDTITEIAEACGLDRSNWYDWLKKPGFEDWYFSEYEKRLSRIRPQLDAIGMKFAKRGEYQFWKDMQKVAGRNLDAPATAVQVNFNQVTDKDVEEFSE